MKWILFIFIFGPNGDLIYENTTSFYLNKDNRSACYAQLDEFTEMDRKNKEISIAVSCIKEIKR